MKATFSYFIIPHGVSAGLPAIMLTPFVGENDYTFAELIEQLTNAFVSTNVRMRVLAIDSRELNIDGREEDTTDLTRLIDYALVNNIKLIHYVSDGMWPSYARMGGLIKMELRSETEKDWSNYPIGELYWYPSGKEATEPALKGLERTACYIVPNGLFSLADTFRFLSTECKRVWAVALPLRKTIEVNLNE